MEIDAIVGQQYPL